MISFFAFSGLFNFISSLLLGILTYLKGRKQYPSKSFVLYFFSVAFWSIGYYFWQISTQEAPALFWSRFLMAGAIFIPIFYFHFIISFLNLVRKYKRILLGGYGLSIFFFIVNFTPYFVRSVEPELFFPFWPKPGIFFHPFLLMFFSFVVYGWYLLLKSLREIKETIRKQQIKYFLLGTGIGFTGGSTNYFLWYGIPIPPYGNILVIFGVLLVTFALLRYHLFEIRVILTEILVGVMGIVLLVLPFLMPTFNLKVLTFIIFLLFCLFGYLLIRATHEEIKRREEMEKLARELKEAYTDIKSLSEMKSEFLKIVNHQLRTPTTIIMSLLSMLLEGSIKGEEKIKETLNKTYLSSQRLITILDDILNAQELVGERPGLNLKPCKIEEIISKVISHFKFSASQKNLNLIFRKLREPPPLILLDEERIERALQKLIDNAILYTEKGEIKISLALVKKDQKDFIEISVKDTGIGLIEEDKKKLFKLFSRGEGIKLHPNGSGLGLFIAKKYVEAHQGTIEAQSEGKDKGSTFIITLPVITEA